jgi:hypothetical protein
MFGSVSSHIRAPSILELAIHSGNSQPFANTASNFRKTVRKAEDALFEKASNSLDGKFMLGFVLAIKLIDITYSGDSNTKVLWSITHDDSLIWLIEQFCYTGTKCIE